MTTKELLEKLKNAETSEQSIDLAKELRDKLRGVDIEVNKKNVYVRKNLREWIQRRIEEEGVSKRQVAIACGILYETFINYLSGDRPLPYDSIEKVLGLLSVEFIE